MGGDEQSALANAKVREQSIIDVSGYMEALILAAADSRESGGTGGGAKDNGEFTYPPVTLGDANNDSSLGVADAGFILIVSARNLSQPDLEIIKAVIDGDKIQVVWVGDEQTTDIVRDLNVPENL